MTFTLLRSTFLHLKTPSPLRETRLGSSIAHYDPGSEDKRNEDIDVFLEPLVRNTF